MGQEILSVAVFESLPGKDQEVIATLRDCKGPVAP